MKFSYGSATEKWILGAGFLTAAALALGTVSLYDLLRLPYLWLPLFLGGGAVLLVSFPLRLLERSPLWRGIYRATPALLMLAAISIGSSFSFPPSTSASVSDYVFHGGEYFAVGLLLARMANPVPVRPVRLLPLLLALAGVLAFGVLDEFHQSFVPHREPSLSDVRTDLMGGAAGILVYTLCSFLLIAPAREPEPPSPDR
jgi:VanZ family protein